MGSRTGLIPGTAVHNMLWVASDLIATLKPLLKKNKAVNDTVGVLNCDEQFPSGVCFARLTLMK